MSHREAVRERTLRNVTAAKQVIAGLSLTQNEGHVEYASTSGCRNCGRDTESVASRSVVARELLSGETAGPATARLCDRCADRLDDHDKNFRRCGAAVLPVDRDAVLDRDDYRCRCCGVDERRVVGDRLHLHPVVPLDAGGHRHPHNLLTLCPVCHDAVHARR
ncbi:HNH endonuclease [Haloarchaeobius sp. DFWS5]|uniref:HNH endonuclease n=1 Tax=Haloarchaeobius sp. DFWS5 TaxID=3446114 RepID=UPI003EBDC560